MAVKLFFMCSREKRCRVCKSAARMTRGKPFFCMGGEKWLDERQTYERLLCRRMANKVRRFIGNYCSQKFSIYRNAGFSSLVDFVGGKPPRLPLSGNSASEARNRKQVAPLDCLKFFPKYSENQKWAAPLDLQKFLPKYSENQKWAAPLDLQKFLPGYSENQKCATHKYAAPLIRRRSATPSRRGCLWAATRREKPPPRGKGISKAVIKISNGLKQSVMKRAMPA